MKNFFLVLGSLFFSVAMIFYTGKVTKVQAESRNPIMLPPENIEHFTFGYRESIADSLWIRVIQDFEFCGDSKVKLVAEPGTLPGTDELSETPLIPARCETGWGFHMLDEITDLSPKLEIAYTMIATGLSIVVDDREGAELLYDKGVKALPKSNQIPLMAAYHAIYETRKFEKGAELLLIAVKNGAPEWAHFLASQIYTRVGRAELAKQVMTEYIKDFEPDEIPPRARQRLAEAEAVLKAEERESGSAGEMPGRPSDDRPKSQ